VYHDLCYAVEARCWKAAGVSHLCLATFNHRTHKRIPGHTMGDDLGALKHDHAAVADVL